jgi:hypothetical protein
LFPSILAKTKKKDANSPPDSGPANRLFRKYAKPRRVEAWFLGDFMKFAGSSQFAAKSYKICSSVFEVPFAIKWLLSPPPKYNKDYFVRIVSRETGTAIFGGAFFPAFRLTGYEKNCCHPAGLVAF